MIKVGKIDMKNIPYKGDRRNFDNNNFHLKRKFELFFKWKFLTTNLTNLIFHRIL